VKLAGSKADVCDAGRLSDVAAFLHTMSAPKRPKSSAAADEALVTLVGDSGFRSNRNLW